MAGDNKPREHVVVVGAGMVGLCTAWFLQEHDIEVTVVDRVGVAGGASWGNAGWLTPGISIPLPEPAVLRYGLRTMLSPSSPVYIPPSADIRLMRFLAGFARNSTQSRWRSAMGSLVPINRLALESFDILTDGGVRGRTEEAKTFLMAYRTEAERRVMLEELEHIRAAGQEIGFDVLTGKDAQEIEPSLSDEIGAAVLLHDQRFINPGSYVGQLADAVRERGGEIRDGEVTAIADDGPQVRVTVGAQTLSCGSVVLASGAWLGGLARRFGVRTIVQAGRGYSFSVAVDHVPAGPVYFPAQRVACTPLGDRLRVAGMMEFRSPEAALDRRRIEAIADTARPLLRGADLDSRQDEWVGSRPCTPDGLPLIGRTRSRRVLVAGGHGMWGITLGPATGRLLADTIATGRVPAELAPFNPLR